MVPILQGLQKYCLRANNLLLHHTRLQLTAGSLAIFFPEKDELHCLVTKIKTFLYATKRTGADQRDPANSISSWENPSSYSCVKVQLRTHLQEPNQDSWTCFGNGRLKSLDYIYWDLGQPLQWTGLPGQAAAAEAACTGSICPNTLTGVLASSASVSVPFVAARRWRFLALFTSHAWDIGLTNKTTAPFPLGILPISSRQDKWWFCTRSRLLH